MQSRSSFQSTSSAHRSARSNQPGITLIEIVITLGIFVLLASATTPYIGSWLREHTYTEARTAVIDAVHEAYQRAAASDGGQSWTLQISAGTLILSGSDATGPGVIEKEYALPDKSKVEFSSSPIVFEQATGYISHETTAVITTGSHVERFIIYENGVISQQ